MTKLTADRRLYVTAKKDRVVEEGAPAGAWLLYAAGRVIGAGDVKRYGLEADEFGRVTYEGCPTLPTPKPEPKPEPKPKPKPADDSDRNDDEPRGRCDGTTKKGARCRKRAGVGSPYCDTHSTQGADGAS